MQVHVKPTREDLYAFNMFYVLHYSKEARRQMRMARIARSFVIVGIVGFFVYGLRLGGFLPFSYLSHLAFALLSLFYVLLSLSLEPRQLKRRVQRLTDEGSQRAALSPRIYKLTEDAVAYDGELTGGWTKWEAIEDIQETEEHIFFILSTRLAYVIPKRAFQTPIDAQQFVETARRYKAESGPMGRGGTIYTRKASGIEDTKKAAASSTAPSTQDTSEGQGNAAREKDDSAFDAWS